MNKLVSFLMMLVVSFFAMNALAWEPPSAPADKTYVVDLAGKLSTTDKAKLNSKIEQVNRSTANEFGILLLPNMDGESIEDVAYKTFRKWGVGKKDLDNGCLIVVSLAERKSRIETGKGVGGDVPDIVAKDILVKNLNPYLKKGDFYGGFDSTLTALASRIESRRAERDAAVAKANGRPTSQPGTNAPSVTTTHTNSGGCSMGGASVGGYLVTVTVAFILFMALRTISRARQNAKEQLRLLEVERLRAEAERTRKIEAARRETQRLEAERLAAVRRNREQAARDRENAERKRCEEEKLRAEKVRAAVIPPMSKSAQPTLLKPVRDPVVKGVRTVTINPDQILMKKTLVVNDELKAAAEKARREAADRAERQRREREENERAEREARARREREDEERRERERRDEEDRRRRESSYSSSSSWGFDSSSSWGGGSSGFGGGGSGGGGSSSDW